MAKGNAVWGIDIGQCSLKALRCTYDVKSKQVIADTCDFIEYPKILSQPDADPKTLVRDAIKEFLSRHQVKGDRVAISVAGQQGLVRFIKLPPVEAKKLPKIVEFEAKQQIPFALEEVIWDYQMLIGGVDSDGMALENEVGLFAMKRDQVFRGIRPLDDAGVEIDFVQLSPVSVFNTTVDNVFGELPPIADYDSDNPPKSVVVLSMGTDTTDLVVTNGFRVWQRSIPLGGNHFTKQLTKELKLTFGKAEHLKRNSREAKDPKKVFQAMRPVFNDLVTEIQRSIGYFESLDRNAKISHIVGMGNAFKLPGLEPYLEKNLGHKVQVMNSFKHLAGGVLEDRKFKKNTKSMAVCYGLALQGLGQSKLRTNLVPREIVRSRMIREKKPWVLAAASVLLVGFAVNYALHSFRTSQVAEERYADQKTHVAAVSGNSSTFTSSDNANQAKFDALKAVGDQIVGSNDRRFQMLELMAAIDAALPREPGLEPGEVSSRPIDAANVNEQRVELYIKTMEMEFFGTEDMPLSGDDGWFNEGAKAAYAGTLSMLKTLEQGEENKPSVDAVGQGEEPTDAEGTVAGGSDLATEDSTLAEEEAAAEIEDIEGSGWVVELSGYHYHNLKYPMAGPEYVRRTLIKNLATGSVRLPVGGGQFEPFTMEELGISHVILAHDGGIKRTKVRNPKYVPLLEEDFDPEMVKQLSNELAGITKRSPVSAEDLSQDKKPKEEQFLKPRMSEFRVQFLWRPTRLSERLEKRKEPEDSTDNQVAGDI